MKRSKMLGSTAALAATALVIAACDGSSTGGGDDSAEVGDPITWMSILHTPTTPPAAGPIEEALEEFTGQEFSITWTPDASREERLNAALASGELADLVTMGSVSSTPVRSALSSGMFWDVEPFLDEFDNLSAIDPNIIDSARVDGGLYGVPIVQPLARGGVLVRQDWLDNLGLEVPRTIEDLTEVARAFTEDDPDGNGQDDTVGFYDRDASFGGSFRSLAVYHGAPNQFGLDDGGDIVADFMTDEWIEAMEWYKEVYDNGWMNQEFMTLQKQNQIDGIAQGRGGIVITGLFEARHYQSLAESADPDTPMEWTLINDMTFEDVERRVLSDTAGGMGGWLSIPTNYAETEDEVRQVLAFIDALHEPEAFDLMTSGIEGQHYELDDDGVLTITEQGTWEREVQPYNSSRPSRVIESHPVSNELENEANDLMAENDEYVVLNPTVPLTSTTYNQQWGLIEQEVGDAFLQYMTGRIEMDDYLAVIEVQRERGLNEVLEEFTTAHHEADQG